MRKGKDILLSIISGGMEICWLYGWAAFSMTAIVRRPFSFPGAIGVFALAAILTSFSMGKGWRIIQVAGLQTLGFGSAVLALAYTGRFVEIFNTSLTLLEWINLILTLIWALMFWLGGATLATRPKAYFTICSRFDIGLTAFFCLFLAKLVMLTKGGMVIDEPASGVLIFSFFLLSLLAIGMVRVENRFSKSFLPGYRGIGVVASFAAVVILSAGSLILFFLPALTLAAGTGYRVIKSGANSLLPVVERILRFMFMGRGTRPDPSGSSPKGHEWDWLVSAKGGWWMEMLEKVMGWGIKGFVALLLLFTLGILIFYVVKWLFSRTTLVHRDAEESSILIWWVRLRDALVLFYRRILHILKGYHRAVELYNQLLHWGCRSGLPHCVSETPQEFGARLNHHFPRLKREIDLIVSAFNEEVYGEVNLPVEQFAQARAALSLLRSPLNWPRRLKIRFFSPGGKEYIVTKN